MTKGKLYKFGEYKFLVSTPESIGKLTEKVGGYWLISYCPPSAAIAFSSPTFSENRARQWLFCNFIKRLHYLSLVMEEVEINA